MAAKKKEPKGNWTVLLKCVVIKEIYCKNCTEQEATSTPWAHSTEETEIDQTHWEVQSVEPND